MAEFDFRARIKITRVDSDKSRLPTPSETVGWIALGLVIACIYWTTKALLALDRQKSVGQFEQVHLPDSLNTSRKKKVLKEAPQEFLVNPDRRLVVSWRNPYQCDKVKWLGLFGQVNRFYKWMTAGFTPQPGLVGAG